MQPEFVLIHSPSVGPRTWMPVAEVLAGRSHSCHVADLTRTCVGDPPFWPRIVDAVLEDLAGVPTRQAVVLAAHSNAGVFVPVVRRALRQPVTALVFVDATLPARDGETPVASDAQSEFLRPLVDRDGLLPRWTDWWDEADVAPMFSDPDLRKAITDEQPRLPLSFYQQRVPSPGGWDNGAVSYIEFGPPYDVIAEEARRRGYAVHRIPGAHLHQIVEPERVADWLLAAGD